MTLKVDATLKGLIEDGYLGEVLSVDLSVHHPPSFVTASSVSSR